MSALRDGHDVITIAGKAITVDEALGIKAVSSYLIAHYMVEDAGNPAWSFSRSGDPTWPDPRRRRWAARFDAMIQGVEVVYGQS